MAFVSSSSATGDRTEERDKDNKRTEGSIRDSRKSDRQGEGDEGGRKSGKGRESEV